MRKSVAVPVLALTVLLVAAPATDVWGRGHHHFGGRAHVFAGVRPWFWWDPYPYWWYYPPAYYYPPPVVVQEPPVYIRQPALPSAPPAQDVYWYYCPSGQSLLPRGADLSRGLGQGPAEIAVEITGSLPSSLRIR
jgi:hypothetical protein